MSRLPSGWAETQLGSLIERVEAGLNVKCEERPPQGKERGLVKISAVTWGRFNEEQSKTLPADITVSANAQIQTGDLLFSRANTIELVGATVLVEEIEKHLYLSDKVLRLVVPAESKRWINYAMKTAVVRKAIQDASSGNQLSMRNISQEKLRQIPIPLAPLPEQKRIADKLDSVLARVDACRDRLDRLPALLKRFRQSILAAATSGRLTEDWRSHHRTAGDAQALLSLIQKEKLEKSKEYFFRRQPIVNAFDADEAPFELPSTWAWARSSQLFLKITDGAHNTPKVLTEGRPYLTSKDIATGRLDFNSKQFISEQDHHELYSKCRPELGDLLITNIGASSGCSALVDTAMEFSFKNIAILKPSRHLESKYLWFHQNARRDSIFSELTRGGAQPFLSLAILGNLFFALPPLSEQTEIVRRVDLLFAFADRLEARLATARRQVGQLTPALLAKAFRGELVAQDPADEPAAELLKRLAAQREAAPKTRRGRASKA